MERDDALRQRTTKRTFSTMAASHRDETPDSLFDDHYQDTEHAARRRRIHLERERNQMPHPRSHYPGDGLDFRRPVMYSAARGGDETDNRNVNANTSQRTLIDLTDEDGAADESQESERLQRPTSAASVDRQVTGSTSSHEAPYIDRSREIIDIGSSGDEEDYPISNFRPTAFRRRPQYGSLRRPTRRPSPHPSADMDDIEFVESRPLSRAQTASRQHTPANAAHRTLREFTPYPPAVNETIDLTEDNDDDVAYVDTRPADRPIPAGTGTHGVANNGGGMGIGRIADFIRRNGNMNARIARTMQNFGGYGDAQEVRETGARETHELERHLQHGGEHLRRIRHHHHHHPGHHHHPPYHAIPVHDLPRPLALARAAQGAANEAAMNNVPAGMPGPMLDYRATAFVIHGNQNPPQEPKYSPPPSPGKGFTRNPAEDEVVVCPNCGDELAMGDSELKQQIWVIKKCGHAYCGECAEHRGRSLGTKKGKGKAPVVDDPTLPPPFKVCVVDGCSAPAAKSSMTHVYLGS